LSLLFSDDDCIALRRALDAACVHFARQASEAESAADNFCGPGRCDFQSHPNMPPRCQARGLRPCIWREVQGNAIAWHAEARALLEKIDDALLGKRTHWMKEEK
jgi:hypothetical protein